MSLSELILTLLVALTVLGPKQLNQFSRTLGRLIHKARHFKQQVQHTLDKELRQQQLNENIKKALEAEKNQ